MIAIRLIDVPCRGFVRVPLVVGLLAAIPVAEALYLASPVIKDPPVLIDQFPLSCAKVGPDVLNAMDAMG